MSYGSFQYANLTVDRPTITLTETIIASVEVTHIADRDGDEVVQLDLHQRHGLAIRLVRELKGFRRIALAAGETRTVQFGCQAIGTLRPSRLLNIINRSSCICSLL